MFRATSERWFKSRDALDWLRESLAAASRDRARLRARDLLYTRTRTSQDTLGRAAARMTDVDLDAAWRAALRGDTHVLVTRLANNVGSPRKRARKGSPWRASGWLRK
jgi:hypothetical protein